jgi:predicted transglutaminase-like cysteine proteinase
VLPEARLQWAEARRAVGAAAPRARLGLVNAIVNAVPYRTDLENYGVADRWSTPLELFSRGGDCECFAIAKYLLLRDAGGLAPVAMRLAALAATPTREAHAVLAVWVGRDFAILDNRRDTVLPSAGAGPERPLFSLNEVLQFGYAAPLAV